MLKFIFLLLLIFITTFGTLKCNEEDYEKYCIEKGGSVTSKVALYDTKSGPVEGYTMKFCQIPFFNFNQAIIGLETFASEKPSLVSTYAKNLVILPNQRVKGPFAHNGANLCYSLGGSSINFYVNGGFFDSLGFWDICMFGDGSHISGWTLLYAALGTRSDIKDGIKGEVLNINIPNIY